MIDHYQPFLFPFFGSRQSVPSPIVKRYFYWSWEDGLWDLLAEKHIQKGSIILLPDFYCLDVIENIQSHGYAVAFYRLDQHFQVKKQTLMNGIRRYKPAVVIIFHACGIQSAVARGSATIREVTKKALVIEDAVHMLINPASVRLVNENHFIMDSLRKVSPFYGSYLYGTKKGMHFHQTKTMWSVHYLRALFLYILFRLTLKMAYVFHQPKMAVVAHEVLLKGHDTIIGDTIPHRGNRWIGKIAQWIDFSKIERMKREQAHWYEQLTAPLYSKASPFYKIRMKRSDYGKLHVYPIGLKRKADVQFIAFLQENGVVVWPKFSDSLWAKKRDVLFLPLGFQVDKQQVKMTVRMLAAWKTGEWKRVIAEERMTSPHLLVRAAQYILSF